MKKIAAILLITIFLFNLVGYRFLFNYAQQQSDNQITASFDHHQYSETELIAVKVPLSMPYQTMQSDWERVDGEMNVNGKIYKYVKRRIVDGEMLLMCLPDHNKMRIQSAKNDFFKSTSDIAQDNTSKKTDNSKTGFFKNLASEYDHPVTSFNIAIMAESSAYEMFFQSSKLFSSPHTPPAQPPDAV